MKKILFLIVSIMLLASCAKDEEVMTGTIAGLVSDYSNANQPLAGVTVTINTKGLSKTTGSDGRFEFASLEPGTYVLQAQADGYQATTKQVTVYAGQTANCDFQLTKSGADVTISPLTLSFGKDVEQLSFSITNNGSQSLTYSISNTPDFVEVSPMSGTVAGKGKQAVSVHVLNRSQITTNRSGQLTVNVGNDSHVVSINVTNSVNTDPTPGGGEGQDGDNQGGGAITSAIVTRGLLAYYTFDDGKTATNFYDPVSYNGQLQENPEFVSKGNGYALRLRAGQYVLIPTNILSGKSAYSISMWVKDFGQGYLFETLNNRDEKYPSIKVNDADKIYFRYAEYYNRTFSTSMKAYQSGGWHMVTLVKNAQKQAMLYVDGTLLDTQSVDNYDSEGTAMSIGSPTSDPMYVDNVRVHSVALSSEEVSNIFTAEK